MNDTLATLAFLGSAYLLMFWALAEGSYRLAYGPKVRRWHLDHELKYIQLNPEIQKIKDSVFELEMDRIRLRIEINSLQGRVDFLQDQVDLTRDESRQTRWDVEKTLHVDPPLTVLPDEAASLLGEAVA